MGRFFRSIVTFLFSRANREVLLFLSFLALAGVFWLITALNQTYEQEVKLLVHYVNVPRNAVMTSPETDTVNVTLRDKGFMLMPYIYGLETVSVDVDFNQFAKSQGAGVVQSAELQKLLETELPASTRLVSIKPERLVFYYNYGEKKRVPVEWRGHVVPEHLYFISGTRCVPDSITIYASKSKLDSITTVYTEDMNYSDFHDTLRVNVALTKIAGVKMVPERVDMSFYTDVLTEETMRGIPVVGINLPEGKVLRTFPAKVSVRFVSCMNTFKTLSPHDFVVVADYLEFKDDPSPKCNIRLQQMPQGISRVQLEMTRVEYLIEDRLTIGL